MDVKIIEQEAKKLFGGATVTVEPYSDRVTNAYDVTIIPTLDHGKRFIRVTSTEGMPKVMDYLKKIQQNLLDLQKRGAFGINVPQEDFKEEEVKEAIEKKQNQASYEEILTDTKGKKGFICECGYKTKFPGIFGIHKRRCKK